MSERYRVRCTLDPSDDCSSIQLGSLSSDGGPIYRHYTGHPALFLQLATELLEDRIVPAL